MVRYMILCTYLAAVGGLCEIRGRADPLHHPRRRSTLVVVVVVVVRPRTVVRPRAPVGLQVHRQDDDDDDNDDHEGPVQDPHGDRPRRSWVHDGDGDGEINHSLSLSLSLTLSLYINNLSLSQDLGI